MYLLYSIFYKHILVYNDIFDISLLKKLGFFLIHLIEPSKPVRKIIKIYMIAI